MYTQNNCFFFLSFLQHEQAKHLKPLQPMSSCPSQSNTRGSHQRFMGPSSGTSLNQSSNSLGSSHADPYLGSPFAMRGPRPPLRPPQQYLQQQQQQQSSFCHPLMDRGVQSSLPSLVSEPHSLPVSLALSKPHLATLQGQWALSYYNAISLSVAPNVLYAKRASHLTGTCYACWHKWGEVL